VVPIIIHFISGTTEITNKNILQLRMSLLNAKIANKTSSIVENDRNQAKVGECRTSAIEFSEQLSLLSEVSRNEPNECMCQWI
jgi:hypothetical protein